MATDSLNNNELCRRYALALFSIGEEKKEIERYVENFKVLYSTKNKHNELNDFFNNPLLTTKKKVVVLDKISKKLKFQKLFSNFLKVVAKHNRLSQLNTINKHFDEIIQTKNNKINVEIVTSIEISKDLNNRLVKKLENITKKKVNLENKIDQNILGGIIIKIGSIMIDSSLRTKLEKCKFSMKGKG